MLRYRMSNTAERSKTWNLKVGGAVTLTGRTVEIFSGRPRVVYDSVDLWLEDEVAASLENTADVKLELLPGQETDPDAEMVRRVAAAQETANALGVSIGEVLVAVRRVEKIDAAKKSKSRKARSDK